MLETPVSLPRNDLKITRRNVDAVRSQWIQAAENLIAEAALWASAEPGWTVTQGEKEIEEDKLGKYRVPTLKIEVGESELHLEPIARYSWRGEGQINFSVFPTFYSVRLLHDEASGEWHIRTDSGIEWPAVWNREVFMDVAYRLLHAL